MSEGKVGSRTAQTFFTSGAGTVLTLIVINIFPEKYVQIGIYISVFSAPFISAYFTKLLNTLDEPDELTKYKAGLKKDIKFCRKCLKDKDLDERQKREHQEHYGTAMSKLSRANTDFHEGKLKIKPVVSKV